MANNTIINWERPKQQLVSCFKQPHNHFGEGRGMVVYKLEATSQLCATEAYRSNLVISTSNKYHSSRYVGSQVKKNHTL